MRSKDEIMLEVYKQDNAESVEQYNARIMKRILEVMIDIREELHSANGWTEAKTKAKGMA